MQGQLRQVVDLGASGGIRQRSTSAGVDADMSKVLWGGNSPLRRQPIRTLCSPKGSRLDRTVPVNMTGSCGMMDRPGGGRRARGAHGVRAT